MNPTSTQAVNVDSIERALWHLNHMWYRPMRSLRPNEEQDFWHTQSDCSFFSDDLPVSARSTGQGPVIVLLHGFNGRGSQFMQLARALSAIGWRVITLDLPGDFSHRVRRMRVQDISRALKELEQRVGPLHGLVVHSMANVWAWHAMAEGLRVAHFVALGGVYDAALCFALYQHSHQLSDTDMHCLRQLLLENEGAQQLARQNPAYAMQHTPRPSRALIVQSAADEVVPLSQGRAYAQAWPEADYLELAHITHTGLLTAPAMLERVCRFFVTD